MTLYPPMPQPFMCAICRQNWAPRSWESKTSAYLPIPPICSRCDFHWGKAIGGGGDRNRDRRLIRHIGALAAIIEAEAHRKTRSKEPIYG